MNQTQNLTISLTVNIVDAFTDQRFKGNSAAVILIPDWLEAPLMQSIASENNLSETAFVKQTGQGEYAIRWFSPLSEIDFCGHATLAAAFVIFNHHPDINTLSVYAQAVGILTITKGDNGFIEMSFPNRKPEPITTIPADLLAGLSITPVEVLKNVQAYFAVYDNEDDVHSVTYNTEKLKKLAPYDVVVTAVKGAAKSTEQGGDKSAPNQIDFVSRYFWPANGGDEDPVTGSIHAGLAPYWAQKLGKQQLNAYQASQRGGFLACRVEGDRVYICGQAVQYLVGTITV